MSFNFGNQCKCILQRVTTKFWKILLLTSSFLFLLVLIGTFEKNVYSNEEKSVVDYFEVTAPNVRENPILLLNESSSGLFTIKRLKPLVYEDFKKVQQNYKEMYEDVESDEEKYQQINVTNGIVCKKASKLTVSAKDATFQKVPNRAIYVYSAYLDCRVKSKRTVRIIGFSPFDPGKIYCQLYYPGVAVISVHANSVDLHIRGRGDHAPFENKPHFYECEEPLGKTPQAVALLDEACVEKPQNLQKLHKRTLLPEKKVPNGILICIKLLYGFGSPHRIIEFLEFQKKFGASKIILYDTVNITNDVEEVINYYQKDKFLEIQPWKLPVVSSGKKILKDSVLRMFGQQCQINDCIYRNMNLFKHILPIDFDELIIPMSSNLGNYDQLIGYLAQKFSREYKQSASLSFLNAHFCLPKLKKRDKPTLSISKYTKRSKYDEFPQRSKSILNPRRVKMGGMHYVTDPITPYEDHRAFVVPANIAYLHHYRIFTKSKLCNITDKSALKYEKRLLKRVKNVCELLGLPQI